MGFFEDENFDSARAQGRSASGLTAAKVANVRDGQSPAVWRIFNAVMSLQGLGGACATIFAVLVEMRQ